MEDSKYQIAVFDWVQNGSGNAVVRAVAGSGKTTTLIKSLTLIPKNKKICLLAFNKSIAEELKRRTPSHVNVQTFHGLGWSVMRTHLDNPVLDDKKVYNHIQSLFKQKRISFKDFSQKIKISNNIKKIIDFLRLNLVEVPTALDIHEICIDQDIEIIDNEITLSLQLYESVIEDSSCYDFVDMLFVPIFKKLKFPKFDWVMTDECQDASVIQQKMMQTCIAEGGRFMAVGDPSQCLLPDTLISTPNGKIEIQNLKAEDRVFSYYDSGRVAESSITEILEKDFDGNVYTIITESGKKLKGTANHITFANYSREYEVNLFCVYLMYRSDLGYRIGLSTTGGAKSNNSSGFKFRANGEYSEKLWILKTFKTEQEARLEEILISLKYSIPTMTFNVHVKANYNNKQDEEFIKKLFSSIDTKKSAKRLFVDFDLFENYPHHVGKSVGPKRRANIIVSLGKGNNSKKVCHTLSIHVKLGSQAERVLKEKGYDLHSSKGGNLRFRICSSDFKVLQNVIDDLKYTELFEILYQANLSSKCLNFCPLSHVREGMIINTETLEGKPLVEKVISISVEKYVGKVYDINLNQYHNYSANGVLVHNCLYGFAGADQNAYDNFINQPNTIQLPLSICYRCGSNIIKAAKQLVPEIEHWDKNGEGSIVENGSIKNIKDGDVVLCRVNFPLAALAGYFLRENRRVSILGSDFGKNLAKLIESCKGPTTSDLFTFLHKKLQKIYDEIVEDNAFVDPNTQPEYQLMLDKINTIRALAENCTLNREILSKIQTIFSDSADQTGILLSTVHKFKGREANNIFIVEPQLIPFPYYLHLPNQVQTENNIKYVAITRAKNKLEYIRDWTAYTKTEKNEKRRFNPKNKLRKQGKVHTEDEHGGDDFS